MSKLKPHNPYGAYSPKEYERDHVMVKGKFRNLETPGASLKFSFKKYPGPVKRYHLRENVEETLPVMVMDFLNNCGPEIKKASAQILGPDGRAAVTEQKEKRQRFAFVPTSFRRIDSEIDPQQK